jgi:hypothetical protein
MKPHVHAEVIKAWADGAEIEYRTAGHSNWEIVTNPFWNPDKQYRVKPKTVVKYHGIMQGTNGYEDLNHTTGYCAADADVTKLCNLNSNNWKLLAIVKTTFVDRVPVAVEIVK